VVSLAHTCSTRKAAAVNNSTSTKEAKAGNPLHRSGIALLEPLIYRGDEALQDVLGWITAEEKKKRPGTLS
jgi:hypothetical protein